MIQSRQVEAFRAVMLTGAMTAAAETIHVSQPAVSRLIRDLEQELGLPLFHRRGNLVVPTAEAQALLAEVERSFIGLKQIRDFADDLRIGRGGSLRVASLPAMAGYVTRSIAAFSRRRPQVKLLIDSLPSSTIRDRISDGRYDLGLVDMPFQRGGFALTPLADHAVVALPHGHRLTQQPSVQAEDLANENLILLKRFADGQHPIQVALQTIRRPHLIDTHIASIACILVSEGMGVAIVDPFSASEYVGRNLVLRPFLPTASIGTALVYSQERPLSAIAQEFHALLLERTTTFLSEARYLEAS